MNMEDSPNVKFLGKSEPNLKIFLGCLSGAQMGSFGQATINQKISCKPTFKMTNYLRIKFLISLCQRHRRVNQKSPASWGNPLKCHVAQIKRMIVMIVPGGCESPRFYLGPMTLLPVCMSAKNIIFYILQIMIFVDNINRSIRAVWST